MMALIGVIFALESTTPSTTARIRESSDETIDRVKTGLIVMIIISTIVLIICAVLYAVIKIRQIRGTGRSDTQSYKNCNGIAVHMCRDANP